MLDVLSHFSDLPSITHFVPRPPKPSSGLTEPVVWAIDPAHRHNYLLPRDCPRVTFYARPDSSPDDVARLMGGTSAQYVVAIASEWLPVVRRACLYEYLFAPQPFTLFDAGAGYYIASTPITPRQVISHPDLLSSLTACDVELRMLPDLRPLYKQVTASSLQFSIIRWRE